jgi:hypothetical protein
LLVVEPLRLLAAVDGLLAVVLAVVGVDFDFSGLFTEVRGLDKESIPPRAPLEAGGGGGGGGLDNGDANEGFLDVLPVNCEDDLGDFGELG